MPTISLQNVAAYSLQTAALIVCSVLLIRLLRLRAPALRLIWFQSILLLCLCLPVLQPWKSTPASDRFFGVPVAGSAAQVEQASGAQPRHAETFSPISVMVFVLCAGIVARMLWTLLGFWALSRYRRTAHPCRFQEPLVDDFVRRFGVTARFGLSDQVAGPITFGLRSPLILLPSRFLQMDRQSQEAILCHELLHVRRKDWVFTVLEEFVLAALWFHPAIWWLVSEIRLSREQVVDREAIEMTGSRDHYVQALLNAACSGSSWLVPATSFLWRKQLVQRVAAITQSFAISRTRLISSMVTVLAGTLLVARMATLSFPISSEVYAQLQSSELIQVEAGGDHLLHRAPLEYPKLAAERHVEGVVAVNAEIDDRGFVSDAHVTSGPQELRRAALQSVLNWQYDPQSHPAGEVQVAIRFRAPAAGETGVPVLSEYPSRPKSGSDAKSTSSLEMHRMLETAEIVTKGGLTGRIVAIRTHGGASTPEVQNNLLIHVGDTIDAESLRRTRDYLQSVDKRLFIGLESGPNGDMSLHVFRDANDPSAQARQSDRAE